MQVCKKTSAQAKAAELAKMRAFKADLDRQIEDNQVGVGEGERWETVAGSGGRYGRDREWRARMRSHGLALSPRCCTRW